MSDATGFSTWGLDGWLYNIALTTSNLYHGSSIHFVSDFLDFAFLDQPLALAELDFLEASLIILVHERLLPSLFVFDDLKSLLELVIFQNLKTSLLKLIDSLLDFLTKFILVEGNVILKSGWHVTDILLVVEWLLLNSHLPLNFSMLNRLVLWNPMIR